MNGCDDQVTDNDTVRPEGVEQWVRAGREETEEDAGPEDADEDRDRGAQPHPLDVRELVPCCVL